MFSTLINRIDSRLSRLGRMIRVVGAFPGERDSLMTDGQIRQAMVRCIGCGAGSACDSWLDDMEACGGAKAAPDFCPNASRFDLERAA